MQLFVPRLLRQSSEQSLESVLSAKYPWVLRWALHFAQNDRAVAEDLVQETFVRILSIRDTLTDLENIEPLLYTHLRFAYLTERRRGRSQAFQSLAVADFDTLAISLRTSSSLDQIEVQNDLRTILAFLLWRRRTAKFASIFLLRFFHGFVPEEIAGICLISRGAVDLGLMRTREELRRNHANLSELSTARRGPAPEVKPFNLALPSDHFANELIKTIFSTPCGICPTNADWERRYSALSRRPLDGDTLAHLVSCRPCLEKVTRECNTPPPSARAFGESLGPARRAAKSSRSESSQKEILARIFAHSADRMREVFAHKPTGLVIAVNAQVVAVRDISSTRSMLKVETHAAETLEMVELFSEQGLLMLMLPVTQRPPQSPPELSNEVALSGERWLSLTVRFTADGALIEALYIDPNFTVDMAEVEIDSVMNYDAGGLAMEAAAGPGTLGTGDAEDVGRQREPRFWLRRIFEQRAVSVLRMRPLLPVAVCVLLAAASIWIWTGHQRNQARITNLVHDIARAERNQRIAHGPGIVHQRVEIHHAGGSVRRDIYRDIDGRRRPRASKTDNDERDLRIRLEQAGVDWNDPLSAAGFDNWHDHVPRGADRIERNGASLLTVTTMPTAGPLLRESLTLRVNDLHPVSRMLFFRDSNTIEIAELSYEVLPWGPSAEGWFEPLSDVPGPAVRHSSNPPADPARRDLSEDEINVAKLGVLLALQELHADTERLQIDRIGTGVAVTGVVENDARKREIVNRLRMIPHVTAEIHSYRDFEGTAETASSPTTVRAMSVTDGASPLDDLCEVRRVENEQCRELAHLLLKSSAVLVGVNSRLTNLELQYPPTRPLTPVAQILLRELKRNYADRLTAAVSEERTAFSMLGVEPSADVRARDGTGTDLNEMIQRNLLLTRELVYAKDEHSRTASLVIQDLAVSAEELRAAVSHMPLNSTDHAEAP